MGLEQVFVLDSPHKKRGTSRRHMWLVGHYNVSIKKKKIVNLLGQSILYNFWRGRKILLRSQMRYKYNWFLDYRFKSGGLGSLNRCT